MKKKIILQNKSFLLRMVIGLFAMYCVCLPANAIHDGILNIDNYKRLSNSNDAAGFSSSSSGTLVHYICYMEDSSPDGYPMVGLYAPNKDYVTSIDLLKGKHTYKKDGYIFIDLQSIAKGEWSISGLRKAAGRWYYANESDVIWQKRTNMHIEPISSYDPNFPVMTDPSTWVKKKGYTIMYCLPVANRRDWKNDSYCMIYFEGKGIYKGFYRNGYAARDDLWYIFDLGYAGRSACLTAGELYNMTLDEYIAANGKLDGVAKKTIWLGEEYTGGTNITEERIFSAFQSKFGLQSNKKGTEKVTYSYSDKVFFPAINIGRGIHHYDIYGRPVYADVIQGDFDYYGVCTAGVTVSGWDIKGDSVFFYFENPTILSTRYYVDPAHYNPMNFDEGALKAYKNQDNIALSKSNVDDLFKISFAEDAKKWLKSVPAQAEKDYVYKILEARPNSILYRKTTRYDNGTISWMDDVICNKDRYDLRDPKQTCEAYLSSLNIKYYESPMQWLFNGKTLQNVLNILDSAANVCVLNCDYGTMELLVGNGNGEVYDCELAITKDSDGELRWNVIRVKNDSQAARQIQQFKKDNAERLKGFENSAWPNKAILTKDFKSFADIAEALRVLPAVKEEAAALEIYEEITANNKKDWKSQLYAKDSLLFKFKDEKKLSAIEPKNNWIFRFKNIDDLAEAIETFMEEQYIYHEYITKGKSADAKELSKKLAKAKTREEIIAALEIKVPDMKGTVKERVKTMVDTTPINIEWAEKYNNRPQNELIDEIVKVLKINIFPEYNNFQKK